MTNENSKSLTLNDNYEYEELLNVSNNNKTQNHQLKCTNLILENSIDENDQSFEINLSFDKDLN